MATLSSVTSFADRDPLTPTHLNSKVDSLVSNIAAVNSAAGGFVVSASNYSGNWDDRVRSAISDLGSFGGTVDASGLSGAQAMGSSLTIATRGVVLKLAPMTLSMGAHRIHVAAGSHSVKIEGSSPYGTLPALGINGSTFLYYTGSGDAVSVGSTAGTRTREVVLQDLGIHCTDAGAGAKGLAIYDTILSEFNRLYIPMGVANSGKTCVWIDGTGGASFNNTFRGLSLTGGSCGVRFTGNGVAAANANLILGGTYSSTSTINSFGLYFDADSNGNAVQSMDIEDTLTAVSMLSTARYNFVFGRLESNGTDFAAGSGSTGNLFFAYGNSALQGINVSAGSSTLPGLGFISDRSLGLYASGNSSVALSYGSLNLNQGRLVSVRTIGSLASSGNVVNNEWTVTIGASVATLAIRSGVTTFLWAASANTNV